MHARSALATTGSSFAFISAARSAQVTTAPSATVTSKGRRHHPAEHTPVGPSARQSLSIMHSIAHIDWSGDPIQADVHGIVSGHVELAAALAGNPAHQLSVMQGVVQIPQ